MGKINVEKTMAGIPDASTVPSLVSDIKDVADFVDSVACSTIQEKVSSIFVLRKKAKAFEFVTVWKKKAYSLYKAYGDAEKKLVGRIEDRVKELRESIMTSLDANAKEGIYFEEDIDGLDVDYEKSILSVDVENLPKEYLVPDIERISKDIKKFDIDGVVTYNKPKITVREVKV